jgi:predicted DNA-binding protein YlxM (UPF0122 family)
MEARVQMALLYDFYGSLLTAKQQRFMELYFGEDLSLGEIASEFNVSRQAVYDILSRAEASLRGYEERLRLVESYQREEQQRLRLRYLVAALARSGLSPEQKTIMAEMAALLETMGPEGD